MADLPENSPDGVGPEPETDPAETHAAEDQQIAASSGDLSKEEAHRLAQDAANDAMFGEVDPYEAEMNAAMSEESDVEPSPDNVATDNGIQAEHRRHRQALDAAYDARLVAEAHYQRALDELQPTDAPDRFQALDAAEEALRDAQAAEDAARLPRHDDHIGWIVHAALIALNAISDWVDWHAERAKQRMIWKENPGFCLIFEAVGEIEFTFGGANPAGDEEDEFEGYFPSLEARNAAVDDAFAKLREGITLASHTAETARVHEDAAMALLRDDQAAELETSHLRAWIRVLRFIDDAYREAALAPANELYWRLQVLEELSSHRCPPIARWFK